MSDSLTIIVGLGTCRTNVEPEVTSLKFSWWKNEGGSFCILAEEAWQRTEGVHSSSPFLLSSNQKILKILIIRTEETSTFFMSYSDIELDE